MRHLTLAALATLAMATTAGAAEHKMTASAKLLTSKGADAGIATVKHTPKGLVVTVKAKGLPAGPHGLHVHTTGKCDAPDFTTAGGHWNPTSHQHGTENPAGPHAGDLPNITARANGTGTASFTLPGGSWEGLFDADGSAIVIHATADDYKTDPSGNSGGRIACGVLVAK